MPFRSHAFLAAAALALASACAPGVAVAERQGGAMPDATCENPLVPRWKVGDAWQVEYSRREPNEGPGPGLLEVKEVWRYEVAEYLEREGSFRVVISSPRSPVRYELLVRRDDFTLSRFVARERDHALETRSRVPGGAYLRVEHLEKLLFDLGSCCHDAKGGTRTFTAPSMPIVTQQLSFDADARAMKVVLSATVWGKRLASEQLWKAGLPWWSEARKTLGDDVIVSGRLVAP